MGGSGRVGAFRPSLTVPPVDFLSPVVLARHSLLKQPLPFTNYFTIENSGNFEGVLYPSTVRSLPRWLEKIKQHNKKKLKG